MVYPPHSTVTFNYLKIICNKINFYIPIDNLSDFLKISPHQSVLWSLLLALAAVLSQLNYYKQNSCWGISQLPTHQGIWEWRMRMLWSWRWESEFDVKK